MICISVKKNRSECLRCLTQVETCCRSCYHPCRLQQLASLVTRHGCSKFSKICNGSPSNTHAQISAVGGKFNFFKVAEFKSEGMRIYENWQVGMKNWNSKQFILAYDTSGSPCSTTPSNLTKFDFHVLRLKLFSRSEPNLSFLVAYVYLSYVIPFQSLCLLLEGLCRKLGYHINLHRKGVKMSENEILITKLHPVKRSYCEYPSVTFQSRGSKLIFNVL